MERFSFERATINADSENDIWSLRGSARAEKVYDFVMQVTDSVMAERRDHGEMGELQGDFYSRSCAQVMEIQRQLSEYPEGVVMVDVMLQQLCQAVIHGKPLKLENGILMLTSPLVL